MPFGAGYETSQKKSKLTLSVRNNTPIKRYKTVTKTAYVCTPIVKTNLSTTECILMGVLNGFKKKQLVNVHETVLSCENMTLGFFFVNFFAYCFKDELCSTAVSFLALLPNPINLISEF